LALDIAPFLPESELKISPELRREFRVYAAERDIDMSVLFADMWAFYKEGHG